MEYRKAMVDGIRVYVVREPTTELPIAMLACRKTMLPIGVECIHDRDWALFDVDAPDDVWAAWRDRLVDAAARELVAGWCTSFLRRT